MSYFEHARNIRPSTILIAYLLFSGLLDIVRCRTLWLVAPESSLAYLFTASTIFKALLLVTESYEKAKFLPARLSEQRPEETSSILNRGVFYWLNRLMIRGSNRVLSLTDLYELKHEMEAEQLGASYLGHWKSLKQPTKYATSWALVKTLTWPLLAPIFPRLILLALTICQPILLQRLLVYLSTPDEMVSKNIGYGIIGAYAFVYAGSALATGFYWYEQYQFLTKVRACLVSAISRKTASLDALAIGDPKAAVTLMSADVERITDGLRPIHDIWASLLQIGIALYLLEQQMGTACVVPVALSVLCGLGAAWVSGLCNKAQKDWMGAVQERIGITSAVLSSMKTVKLRGMVEVLSNMIQGARQQELRRANRWRWLLLTAVALSFIPEYLSPFSTFLVFIIQARANRELFDVSRAFTTVSLLTVMTQPLNGLLQSLPGMVSAMGCLSRIGDFLSCQERTDFRDFNSYEPNSTGPQSQPQLQKTIHDHSQIELETLPRRPQQNRLSEGDAIVRITHGSFAWGENKDVLSNLSLEIPYKRLTCIIGPIASGKSTLCHTFLGETHLLKGNVELFTPKKDVAFCHQSAHLINGTVKENIIGFSEPDETWYDTIIRACALQEDISTLPQQDQTRVGSGGLNLSGGQRQKVALARALFARKDLIILDDVFSGFDNSSQRHVFNHVLGPNGLARQHNVTIVFATHAIKFLTHADHIIALGSDGQIVQQGSYKSLRRIPGYVQELAINDNLSNSDQYSELAPVKIEDVLVADNEPEADSSRQLGDFQVYRYYLNEAGTFTIIRMLLYVITVAAFLNLSTFWLKLWTDASSKPGKYDYYKYLGVYGLFEFIALISLLFLVHNILITLATKTGLELHRRLLRTVANATLYFFSTTDNGSITNRFSQDMSLVDSQLPLGLLNLTFSAFIVVGQIILIVVSSPWLGLTLPVILIVFYTVQKFYLRTSRQLRLLDLETKSPLYTNFLETLSGLSTIRAFGWTEPNIALNHKLLDMSQKPLYLLDMIQRWLTFVLDMIVGILAVLIAAIAILRRSDSGFAGVALTQILRLNLTLRSIIVAWTEVETSIGSVSRVKKFSENTASEHSLHESSEPPVDWPHSGKVELKAMTAVYETVADEPALQNLNMTINPGEKIGVCGRSGSGKSSLVLALLRMLEIQSGTIHIDGLDLQQLPRNAIRQRLNVIPQDSLFLPLTVRANLDPSNESDDSAMIDVLNKVELWSVFESRGGLDAVVSNEILSHGQRQLFSLASAMLKKSKIVILDEATSK